MKPILDKIFAKKILVEHKTESGIILPEKTKHNNLYEVLAVGNKVQHVKVGDKIKKYHAAKCPSLEFNGELIEVLREEHDIEFII